MKTTLTAIAALMIAVSPLAAQTNTPAPSAISFASQQSQNEVLGTDFWGTDVVTKDGQKIGDINNLVFDPSGRISQAVIGVGGFLGLGQKEVAVPLDSLKSEVRENKHVLIIDSTKEQLQAAPAYKTLNDQAFNQRIAEWRGKATESWNQAKDRAGKAYEDTKSQVRDATQPTNTPAPRPTQ